MVRLVFLGRLEDVAGAAEMQVAAGSLADVMAGLDTGLSAAVTQPRIRLALNGQLIADTTALVLTDGDELAFLPPVSGG